MKIKTLLIAVVLILGLAATASASTQWTVGASPEPLRVATGYTEKVGAISFNTVENPGYTVTGTITIDYGKRITVPASSITVTTFCGGTSPCPGTPDLNNILNKAIEENTKLVLRVIPVAGATLDYGFVVDGVRIDVTGYGEGDLAVNALVTASGNQITNGQASALVLQRIANPIASFTNTAPATDASIINGIVSSSVTLTAVEKFRNAFWQTMITDPTQNTVQRLYITPTVAIPAGITITFPATDSTGIWTRGVTPYLGSNSALTYSGTVYYELNSDSDVSAVENFVLAGVTVAADTAVVRGSVYPATTKVYLQIDLGPFPNGTTPYTSTNIPRYKSQPLASAVSVINFAQDFTKTVLMVPYASNQAGFDTGLAVANTTLDPFEDGDLNGTPDATFNNVIDGAVAQTGKIVFYLYPNLGDPFMVSTATSGGVINDEVLPAKELDATGKLPAGKTYSLLLSQLVAAGGYDADTFEGYILIVCDFTNAHGQYFVTDSDFSGFSNGAVMLVVDSRYRVNTPETFGQ